MLNAHTPTLAPVTPTPYLARVYGWMTLGLLTSAAAALVVASAHLVLQPGVFFGLAIAELALVFGISFRIDRLSPGTAAALFFLYSTLTGVTLSSLCSLYDLGTVALAFLASAAMFGIVAAVGYTTRRDLSGLGGVLFMALAGVVVASLVGLFWHFPGQDLIVTYLGLMVFLGLAAYDSWRLRREAMERAWASGAEDTQFAVLGALTLYLDLINIFIRVLRILGGRRRR